MHDDVDAEKIIADIKKRRGGDKAKTNGKEKPIVWPEPTELPRGLAPVLPFKEEYLPEPIAPWVMDVSDRMQCPPEMIAIGAVCALGSLVGRQCAVRPERNGTWTVFANLWAAIVGRSGSLKTPAMQESIKPLFRMDNQAFEAHKSARSQYETELKIHKMKEGVEIHRAKEDAKKNKRVFDFQFSEPPPEPKYTRYTTNDSSYQKLGELLEANPRGILVVRDELISLLRHLDHEQNSEARGFYMTGWNGDSPYIFDRIGRGTIRLEAICVSMIGCTTPEALSTYVKRAMSGGEEDIGLIQRFGLIAWPDQTDWKPVDRSLNLEARNKAYDVFNAIDKKLLTTSIGEVDEYGGPPFLHFDSEAQGLFDDWRVGFEKVLRSDSYHAALLSHFAKYRKLVPALALINYLSWGGRKAIDKPSLAKAIAFAKYLASHAKRLYGSRRELEVAAAHAILKGLRAGKLKKHGFTASEIHQKDWSALTQSEQVQSGLEMLIEYGWVAPTAPKPNAIGGRPTIKFVVHPKLNG